MTEQQNQQNATRQVAGSTRNPGQRTQAGLDRGVESLVAMDNPDDSQLGAERTQSSDDAH